MDEAGSRRDLPEHDGTTNRVAERRPEGACSPTYAGVALKLHDMGYEPLPLLPAQKRPAVAGWTTCRIDDRQVSAWARAFPDHGVGLRTGRLVAVDIDMLDVDAAHDAMEIVRRRLGDAPIRVGLWPKRLMLYRTEQPFSKKKAGQIEVLGAGQQFVAFGIHPGTGRPYDWPDGGTPLDTALDDLTLVTEVRIEALLAELAPLSEPPSFRAGTGHKASSTGITRSDDGLVTDGRDDWLSRVAFHAVHDALDRGDDLDEATLAATTWARFAGTTDLSRPRQDGRRAYDEGDALRKVRDKLRLHREGRLPDRGATTPEIAPDYALPNLGAGEARLALEQFMSDAMARIEAWHPAGQDTPAPRLGLRATTGLGKSTAARRHVAGLVARLRDAGLPSRILNLVPSLALADETATAWTELGLKAVVLRGYEARDPVSREPMCLDLPAVRAAADAGVDIQSSACFRSQQQRCSRFSRCLKQKNRAAVAQAQVVVAAYDAMFTGFAGDEDGFAMLLIDEACWSRSLECSSAITLETLPLLGLTGIGASRRQDSAGAQAADVMAARQKLAVTLATLPPGEVTPGALGAAGITLDLCREAREAEHARLPPAAVAPGQSLVDRKRALALSAVRGTGLKVIGLWSALCNLLGGEPTATGKLWLGAPAGKDGQRAIRTWSRKTMTGELVRLPVLHLDATLRPDLASVVLPGIEVSTITAAAPHQHVRLIHGPFGKSTLCQDGRGAAVERQRRTNRLQEVVDYVRWHALRHGGGRCLVITYKDIEQAFAGIPGVETAHYNAVAGLDAWGDIACLFLVGRPLPSSQDLLELTGAIFDHSAFGGYVPSKAGLHHAGSRFASHRVTRHPDALAETLRAAICDDEVMQALGRGRGINRTQDNPLEVHVLADVALPIMHDQVASWRDVCPDIVQRMLLAGLAVDSPADAALLHPGLFGSGAAAEHAIGRSGFNRQNPIRDLYREMAVKSAAYRRGGRGRGWQRASWIEGAAAEARQRLEEAIGPVAEWIVE